MRLALECPNYLLKDVQPLVDFDWILTHLVLQDEVYAKHYRGSKNFKVLDNSVNELLEPCSLDDMEKAYDILEGADLVVPPDYLGDSKATKDSLDQALSIWEHDKLLPVIQGETANEVMDCASDYTSVKLDFDTVAVPYDITCKRTDSRNTMAVARSPIVNHLTQMGLKVHLLGFTTLDELRGYTNNPKVRSVDTGVPIVYGMNLEHLDEPWEFKKDKPTMFQMEDSKAFWDPDANSKLSAIFWNIAYLRKVLNGG